MTLRFQPARNIEVLCAALLFFACVSAKSQPLPAQFPESDNIAYETTGKYWFDYEYDLTEDGGGIDPSSERNNYQQVQYEAPVGQIMLAAAQGAGAANEIRQLVEAGSPSSLRQALALITQNNAASVEYGRVMGGIANTLLEKVYGEEPDSIIHTDFPQTHKYVKIIRDGEAGRYTVPSSSSTDYLELTLPFLALLNETQMNKLSAAIPDLEKAKRINPEGALAPCFLGMLYEKMPRFSSAASEYKEALAIAPDCHAATLGLARIMAADGWQDDAINLLTGLEQRYPDNLSIKRQLISIYINERQFDKANAALQQALALKQRDGELLLLQARYLIERGQAAQAQFTLDAYIQSNKETAAYSYLRARIAAEGYNNRAAALSVLRPVLRVYPNDFEIRLYTVKLLLESTNEQEYAEGRSMLAALLNSAGGSAYSGNTVSTGYSELLELAVQDAIRRSDWNAAKNYRDQIPEERLNSRDLLNSYEIEQGLGNKRGALSYARQMREKYPDNEDGNIAYITALIEAGQKAEASRVIDERLSKLGAGSFKSRYYFLRSRLQTKEDDMLGDLRSALFENPRNLDAIIALFEFYDKRGDERRAVYYLKQAAALSPANSTVKNYEKKYAGKL
ncbi:MAG: tetratricopeptide repeat protein [Spirochaetaceae bacterium]|jgi:Tfp pilus assembly protein PilF|nr:tetratricopeptide repeat protein [Spirochaetaceae bacterium]